jgi:hypothetical protein
MNKWNLSVSHLGSRGVDALMEAGVWRYTTFGF